MKKILMVFLLLASALVLTGCSYNQTVCTTNCGYVAKTTYVPVTTYVATTRVVAPNYYTRSNNCCTPTFCCSTCNRCGGSAYYDYGADGYYGSVGWY